MEKILETEKIDFTKDELFEVFFIRYLKVGFPKSLIALSFIYIIFSENRSIFTFLVCLTVLSVLLLFVSVVSLSYSISSHRQNKYKYLFYKQKILIIYDDDRIDQFNINNIIEIKEHKLYFFIYTNVFDRPLIIPLRYLNNEILEHIQNINVNYNNMNKTSSIDFKFIIKNILLYILFIASIIPFYGILVPVILLVYSKLTNRYRLLGYISLAISVIMSILSIFIFYPRVI